MQACESAYSSWKFSGGFRTWVKMSLVKTKEEDGREAVEFRQEVGGAGFALPAGPFHPWPRGQGEKLCRRDERWAVFTVSRGPVPGGRRVLHPLPWATVGPQQTCGQETPHLKEQVTRPPQPMTLAFRGCMEDR